MRILLVEDEKKLASLIKKVLEKEKYAVDVAYDGQESLEYALTYPYDVIILDVFLPKKDGFQVIQELRRKKILTPVLMLTAKDAIEDKIQGLDLGADDYLTKPFDFGELLARLRALVRRETIDKSTILQAADLTLDPRSHTVKRQGKIIRLTSREYALLEFLLRHKNQILSRETIIDHVWDSSFEGITNIVDVYIRYLRRKIDTNFSPKLIHTIRGIGYTLSEDYEK